MKRERPYTDTFRRLMEDEIRNDYNAEFNAGIICLNKHFKNRGLVYKSCKFWNWFRNQYEYFTANVMIDCGITPEDTELHNLEKEALKSAYKAHYRELVLSPPFPPSKFFTKQELSITI
ncbi:MAG: hypothetical protein ACPGSD_17380 [Flavobacteriales bacterium]